MSKFDEYLRDPANRERLIMYFLPEHSDDFNLLPRERLNTIIASILGTEDFTTRLDGHLSKPPEEDPAEYVRMKENGFTQIYFRYSRIFELCRVLGVSGIYDIGCQQINQAFLLTQYTTISYTGISPWGFDLNDYRAADMDEKNYKVITTNQTPAPLCDGRISFVKGYYPRDTFDIKPNNIAVACYSFTMLREEEEIRSTVAALKRDFDRVLFNITCFSGESGAALRTLWKNADWTGFEIYPIGPQGFLFATKHPDDIARLKAVYPFRSGRFITGIDDFLMNNYVLINQMDEFKYYIEW